MKYPIASDSFPTLRSSRSRAARVPIALALASSAVLALLGGCGRIGLGADESAKSAAKKARPGDEQIALVLDGREISVGELNEQMQEQFLEEFLRQPEERQYEMRESAVRELIQHHVVEAEAEKRGLTPDALFEEVTSAVAPVSVEDVTTWYKQNEARLGGAPLDAIAPQIERMLGQERKAEAWNEFIDPKLEALSWEMVLAPPRREVEVTRLVRGPADARVTLVTFSDYQCPYCIRSEKVLADVLAKYPEDVRLVHRHFPLDQIHPFARPAAEAAMCADEQGKFWAFHDAIFALNGRIDESSFDAIAGEIGLDGAALGRCIEEGRFKDYVENDARAGEAAGVTGTPAFFVNGIPMKGARDVADLSRVIDGELARLAAVQ
jgi:predicted DsbA family dithiol-disulfide isomerase